MKHIDDSKVPESGARALVFEVGYQLHVKTSHIIRIVFQDARQCTRIHRLGVQKRAKLKKG